MARCLHIQDSGFRCLGETFEPTEFCDAHQRVLPFERLEDPGWRKFTIRCVAFALLIVMLLLPLFFSFRDLYWGPPPEEAQEAW